MTASKQRPKAAPPLPLERFAALSAEIDAGVAEPELLEREQLDEGAWAAAKAYWLRRMADEAERKRFETSTRYQAIFKAKRAVFESKLRRERDRASRAKVELPESEALKAAARELSAPMVSELAPLNLPDAPPSTVPTPMPPVHHPPLVHPGRAQQPPAQQPSAMAAMAAMMQPTAPPPVQAQPTDTPAPPAFVATPPIHRTGPVGPIPRHALPFDEPSSHDGTPPVTVPAPVTSPAPDTHPAPPPRRKWSTIVADVSELGEAMPFKAASPGAPRPPASASTVPAPPAASAKSASLSSTMTSPEEGTTQEMMPFSRQAAPAAPPARADQARADQARADQARADQARAAQGSGKRRHLASTMMVDPSEIDERGLPFGASGSRATPPPVRAVSPQPMQAVTAPTPAPVEDDDDDQPRTKAIDPEAVRAALAAATPFGGRGSSPAIPAVTSPKTTALDASAFRPPTSGSLGPKRFSINVFASLTAEIAERPGDVETIRRKYGLSEAEHHEESQRWTEDFAQNEELRKRYLGIVQRYRGYLKGRG